MTSKVIPKGQWKWFGTPGHFICSRWCRFHLCTQVGDYLVSTVGEYVHPRHSNGSERTEAEWLKVNWPGEDIGFGRKYETLVFNAGFPCSEPGCMCDMPDHDGMEIDSRGTNSRQEATANHMTLCEKWACREVEVEEDNASH
jgi:hypothetical protein